MILCTCYVYLYQVIGFRVNTSLLCLFVVGTCSCAIFVYFLIMFCSYVAWVFSIFHATMSIHSEGRCLLYLYVGGITLL
jgi:hypothetical protein